MRINYNLTIYLQWLGAIPIQFKHRPTGRVGPLPPALVGECERTPRGPLAIKEMYIDVSPEWHISSNDEHQAHEDELHTSCKLIWQRMRMHHHHIPASRVPSEGQQ